MLNITIDLLSLLISSFVAVDWPFVLGSWRPTSFQSVLCKLEPLGHLTPACVWFGGAETQWGTQAWPGRQRLGFPHWVNSSLQPRHYTHSATPRDGDRVGIVCQHAAMQGM